MGLREPAAEGCAIRLLANPLTRLSVELCHASADLTTGSMEAQIAALHPRLYWLLSCSSSRGDKPSRTGC